MEERAHFGEQTADIVTHERTYHSFSILTRWAMLAIGTAILWFTLWFATGAGFWGGTIVAAVAFVLGYYVLVKHEENQPLDIWTEGR